MTVDESQSSGKRMRLRYAGTCRTCAARVAAGQPAVYLPHLKEIECLTCATGGSVATTEAPTWVSAVEPGVAGASARREYERRVAKREQRIRSAHPKIGGLILAVTDDPQSTRAWEQGAVGEECLAERLDALTGKGVLLLHDRGIRGSRANIDHIAISPAGIFVIDAKRYAGRPRLQVEGGILRPRTEMLVVGDRNQTKLVAGMHRQLSLVRAATRGLVPPEAVRGMLCFVGADWPVIGGSFVVDGVDVLWPAKAADKILADCAHLTRGQLQAIHNRLASTFPIA